MALKFEYPGGVLPEERPVIERFENEVFPYTLEHGPEIGDAAMAGNLDATEIIRRQKLFCEGLPHLRETNLRMLVAALNRWKVSRAQ